VIARMSEHRSLLLGYRAPDGLDYADNENPRTYICSDCIPPLLVVGPVLDCSGENA
jgi:hypothetical protein